MIIMSIKCVFALQSDNWIAPSKFSLSICIRTEQMNQKLNKNKQLRWCNNRNEVNFSFLFGLCIHTFFPYLLSFNNNFPVLSAECIASWTYCFGTKHMNTNTHTFVEMEVKKRRNLNAIDAVKCNHNLHKLRIPIWIIFGIFSAFSSSHSSYTKHSHSYKCTHTHTHKLIHNFNLLQHLVNIWSTPLRFRYFQIIWIEKKTEAKQKLKKWQQTNINGAINDKTK